MPDPAALIPGPHVNQPPASALNTEPKTSWFAIVALVTGLIGGVVFAVGFAIVALVQIRRRNRKGKRLVIGGLVAAAIWTVVIAVVVVGALPSGPDRDHSGRITKRGKATVAALKVGDCFTGLRGNTTNVSVTALPCAEPHDSEVVARINLADGSFPGAAELDRQAKAECDKQIGAVYNRSRYAAHLKLYASSPDKASWDDGDQSVACVMQYTGGGRMTAALTNTIDRTLTPWNDVRQGDCFREWTTELFQRTVACTEPHRHQVIATHELTWGPRWPGDKAMEKKAWAGCEKRITAIFGMPPSLSLLPVKWSYVRPSESQWGNGIRDVICLAEAETGTLNRSILPR
ncbi:septum formation family protein [Actinomadura sp. 6N118]|uniref:DUF4190 domain-containing protein n=1 Tax=Actinomadura sp. 6N118 TaxID=3375151 RepID=UPI0037BC9A67